MREFKKPKISVVRLAKEDVITGSMCYGVTCHGYYCDDCAECNGSYSCPVFLCKAYERP